MSFVAHTDVHQMVADRSTDAAVNRSWFNLIKWKAHSFNTIILSVIIYLPCEFLWITEQERGSKMLADTHSQTH